MKEEFEVGDKVGMTLAPEILGFVTAICIRRNGKTYEVTWIHNGDTRVAWLEPCMIKASEKVNGSVGFNRE